MRLPSVSSSCTEGLGSSLHFVPLRITDTCVFKRGGGWFDALGTTPVTYLEQARQTVLADARELMLFCYGNLITQTNKYDGWEGTGIANVEAFRKELPQLFELARIIRGRSVKGINLPKLPNSEPFAEPYVYSFIGMLGLPLVPSHGINELAEASVFPVHMLKQPGFSDILQRMLNNGKTVVVTDGLAIRLTNQELLKHTNLAILEVKGEPRNLLKLKSEELRSLREKLLAPMGLHFDAPNKVGFYLFDNNYCVIENFNNESIDATIGFKSVSGASKSLMLPAAGNAEISTASNKVVIRNLSPRSLIVFRYQ